MGAELFHADGRTDGQTEVRKLIIASYNFAKSPKKQWCQTPQVVQVDHVAPRCRRRLPP
jgi:hypothetical protein